MKKVKVLWVALSSVFLVVFNVLFFVIAGTDHYSSVWISYGSILFSYAMLLITPLLVKKGASASVFRFSLFSISLWYFFIAFFTGLTFIILEPYDYKIALIVQLSMAGIYLVLLILNMIANERTAEHETARYQETQFVKTASGELYSVMNDAKDAGLRKKIEDMYDAVRTSPVKSDQSVSSLEESIMSSIFQLRDIIAAGNTQEAERLMENISQMVTQRNNRLRSLN